MRGCVSAPERGPRRSPISHFDIVSKNASASGVLAGADRAPPSKRIRVRFRYGAPLSGCVPFLRRQNSVEDDDRRGRSTAGDLWRRGAGPLQARPSLIVRRRIGEDRRSGPLFKLAVELDHEPNRILERCLCAYVHPARQLRRHEWQCRSLACKPFRRRGDACRESRKRSLPRREMADGVRVLVRNNDGVFQSSLSVLDGLSRRRTVTGR